MPIKLKNKMTHLLVLKFKKLMKNLKLILVFFIFTFLTEKANSQSKFDVSAYPIHLQFKNTNKPIILFITGDGGWNSFSTQLTNELFKNGYPIIAFDSKKYFWDKKTPLQFGKDVQVILDQYLKEWNKESFIIIGYSFGADVSSFLPVNLSKKLADKLNAMVLLSPGYTTGFEVKLMAMLNSGGPSNLEKYKVYPELLKLKIPISCVFGADDDNDFKLGLKETEFMHKIIIPGNHHFNDDIFVITKAIMKGL